MLDHVTHALQNRSALFTCTRLTRSPAVNKSGYPTHPLFPLPQASELNH
jgi:hypothetical protein